jgi:tetratricopeptide (TPR) repeat protein
LVHIAGFSLGALLIILPVTIRNYVVGRDFVPIASQGGVNFFIGNNPRSDGFTAIVPGTDVSWWGGYWDAISLAEKAEGRTLRASQVSNYWFKQGLEFMRENPKGYLRLLLRKVVLFWGGAEISNNKDIYFFSRKSSLLGLLLWPGVIFCPFGIVAPLALAGMVLSWRRGEGKRMLLVLFVFSYMVSVVLFFVTARFRLVVIPLLLPFAAYSLVYFFREKRLARILFAVALILVFGLVINLNLASYSLPPAEGSHTAMGQAYLEKKMYHQAEAEFRLALSGGFDHKSITAARLNAIAGLASVYEETGNLRGAIDLLEEAILLRPHMVIYPFRAGPDMETLRYHLGRFYYSSGRLDDAIAQWQETIRLRPELPEPYVQLSSAYEDKGQVAEAHAILEQAIQVDQGNFLAHYNLANLHAKQTRIDEAVDHYKKTIEISPAFVDAYASLAWIYAQTGSHLDEGIQLVRRALEYDENSRACWVTLAELYIKKGETEKAGEIFRRMIQREPQEAYWRRRLEEIEN